MTTIAYREGVMASDGRMCADNHIMAEDQPKVLKLKDGTLMGFSGAVGEIMELWDEYESAGKFLPKEKLSYDDLTVIAVTKDGTLWEYCDEYPRFMNMGKKQYHACGSGGAYALAAMAAGASAIQAIEIAKQFDSGTGGQVTTVEH